MIDYWTKEHDCLNHSEILRCDYEVDFCKCRLCGKEWTEKCGFDDDCT